MKHLAAYLLLIVGGNTKPSAEDIKEVLASVGVDYDEERLNQLLNELSGKDIHELIAIGSSKLATGIGSSPSAGETEAPEPAREIRDDCSVEGGCCDDCGDEEDFGFGLFE
ncbi:ribosomal protein P2 [Aspergillus lucknowensis]|uniref:60S acidic ribosomal protein P2 n=1 Tax=Aspergillus lucknowensis TaxID=176173 RepID=A0ABR4LYT7_9EURO